MQKSKIEWTNYSINPVKGLCPVACKDNQGKEYCYARRMYRRFKWNPKIRFAPEVYDDISVSPRGQRIFVGSTIELFGDWVRQEWLNFIIKQCYVHPWHTFIFLTKQYQNLAKWTPFPPNCWVGVSVTNRAMWFDATWELQDIKASVKFLSFEPLLSWAPSIKEPLDHTSYISDLHKRAGISWVIIGACTPYYPKTAPKIEWVQEIVEAADKAEVKVFLKDNMTPLLKDCIGIHAPYWQITDPDNIWPYVRKVQLRQEFPR